MVLDGAGWHHSNALCVPANMHLLTLPPYAPELNPVEHLWDELREKYFHNRVFGSLDALADHLLASLRATEHATEKVRSIVA
ncbi:transposase [Rhodanobacter geophilus]|uniref:Transposase n=1 Tax=Rhodanobacter geophilus TaxID=3162488 RepID=A0ABV3QKR2_9GAMM